MKMYFVRVALLAAPALFLSACGGGGSDGGSAAPAVPQVSQLVITSGNAQAVAAQSLQTAVDVDAAATGAALVTGVQVDASTAAARPLQLSSAARKLVTMVPESGALATGVEVTNTVNCSGGGSLTVTENASGGTGAVAGDSVTMTANNCVETVDGSSMRMNGSMTVSIVSGSYDSASTSYPKSVSMKIVATNFSISQGGITSLSHGDLTLGLIENSASAASVTLSASSLSNTVTTSAGSYTTTLKSYSHKLDASPSGLIVQLQATVETNSSRLGTGTVSYQVSTPAALVMDSTGAYTSGSLKVTGAASALLLTVTSTDTFQLQLDTNGDGTYDSASTVSRTQLQAAL